MKNLYFLIGCALCFASSSLLGQCAVELFITNPVNKGKSYSFDVEMRSNIGDIVLGDSDFNITDTDGIPNFTGPISESGIPGASVLEIGTKLFVHFTSLPDFAPTIGANRTKIMTLTLDGYNGGHIHFEWDGAIIHYFDEEHHQHTISDLCFNSLEEASTALAPVQLEIEELPQNAVQLFWNPGLERQSSQFDVEHSTDGTNWQVIEHISGKDRSRIKQMHQYIHEEAALGNNYYRLRESDQQGNHTFSNEVFIQLSGMEIAFEVYPNPTTDLVNIYLEKGNVTAELQLVDQTGRTLRNYRIDEYTKNFTADLGNFPKGIYILSLVVDNKRYNKKLVLQ